MHSPFLSNPHFSLLTTPFLLSPLQLLESESSHRRLSEALQAVEHSQQESLVQELEDSLKSKEQEIIQLKNIDKERVSKLFHSPVLNLSETRLRLRSGQIVVWDSYDDNYGEWVESMCG